MYVRTHNHPPVVLPLDTNSFEFPGSVWRAKQNNVLIIAIIKRTAACIIEYCSCIYTKIYSF